MHLWKQLAMGAGLLTACVAFCGCGSDKKPAKSLSQQHDEAMKVSDASLRARRLTSVAQKQHQAGDLAGTRSSLGAAREAAMSVADPVSQSSTLTLVAAAHARLEGSSDDIKSLLKESAKAIDKIEDPGAKVLPLTDLASATSQHLQDAEAAAAHLKSAEEAAGSIELPARRVHGWGKIAAAYSKAGRAEDVKRVMAVAQAFADEQADPRAKADCLAEIAVAWHALQQPEPSQAAFAAAQASAATIAEEGSHAYALLNIAQKASVMKQKAEAKRILSAAQDVAAKVKDGSIRGPLVEEIDAALKKL